MPKPGLSLVGFMDAPTALLHLRSACVPDPTHTDADLLAVHQLARANLGAPSPRAGNPEILPAPPDAAAYISQLSNAPWASQLLQSLPGWSIRLVEIDPLISYQYTVLSERSEQHCGGLNDPSPMDLFPVCLPLIEPQGEFIQSPITPASQSVMVKARDLNIRVKQWGVFNLNINGSQIHLGGMAFGYGSPLVYVGRFNGRCYLANGYHRAYGVRMSGATHIPCIFRDAGSPAELGIGDDGSTFPIQRLEQDDPPTVGHFTQNRACGVNLRLISRFLHVSWSQYVLPDE